ncbi:hypothetical protein QBC46DRAFT_35548 [Diplogelasinospora grovesii]|uniref:Uncharacterized protein n=1 Tax=Diplogelasinospora grovesii TaxID=303347 RepID=A0AAN6S746_9PEZI|nr:hypothetical protein QBC46DRAFT_35548 [Diplogelasinospora grovesii]
MADENQTPDAAAETPASAATPVQDDAEKTEPESSSAPASGTVEKTEVPAEFPKKRRGRPPGRPNMTVRESDYTDNPLVRNWNAAKLVEPNRSIPAIPIRIRDALTESSLVHDTQRYIFRMPSREIIYFVQGWITARHIASQRPSYVNGLLIHSRGEDSAYSCTNCVERRAKNAIGPFLTCRILPGSYHNSCSNCKWFDNTSACSLYTGPKPNRKRKAKEELDAAAAATNTLTPPQQMPAENGAPGQETENGVQSGEAQGEVGSSAFSGAETGFGHQHRAQQHQQQYPDYQQQQTQQTQYQQQQQEHRSPQQRKRQQQEPQQQPQQQPQQEQQQQQQQQTYESRYHAQEEDAVEAQITAQLLPEMHKMSRDEQ